MGSFSFISQDYKEPVADVFCGKRVKPVFLIDNQGQEWREDNYEGYGVFGGKDFFELCAEMNGKTTRDEGIEIFYGDEPFSSPNVNHDPGNDYIDEAPEVIQV